MPLSCESALSDLVLQAARQAMPANVQQHFADPTVISRLPEKQRPLLPLLMSLLDAAQATAAAIADNAWDDSAPLDRQLADSLSGQCYRIGADLVNATQCADASGWSLPSMTGKELV